MKQSNVIFKALYLLLSYTLLVSTPVMSDPLYGKTAFDDMEEAKAAPAIKKQSTKSPANNAQNKTLKSKEAGESGAIEEKAAEGKRLAKKANKEPTEKPAEEAESDNLAEKAAQERETHFKNIDELVVLRAPGLAYSYLQREQPVYDKSNPLAWLYWEQKRIVLLQYMRKWPLIDQRVLEQKEKLSNFNIATADRNWFLIARLRALMALKHYDIVLNETRQLLWNASELVNTDTLASWRRIIIQVYLNQGMVEDTQIAMRRYQQDYGALKNEDGVFWLQLQAQLLIELKQYDEAIVKLKKIGTSQAQALILLAQLRAKTISPADVLDRVQLELVSVTDDVQRKALLEYVALVGAIAGGDIEQAIFLLESLLSNREINLSDSVVQIGGVKIEADTLWDLYLDIANKAANNKGLLRGDDVSWYTLASNVYLSEPIVAKSLFAVLSLKSKQLAHREQAMMQLVSLIETSDQSLQLVNRLFTESEKLANLSAVPAKVRYLLVDYSLLQGDVKNAADLMADLDQPPLDQPKFEWNLRRARVLILSGSFVQGAQVLREMLQPASLEPVAEVAAIVADEAAVDETAPDEIAPDETASTEVSTGVASDQADKYLQVVFDLQAVEQYQLSLDLFNQLQNALDDVRLHRELMFWKAESYHALGQYPRAAYLFLKSAVSPDRVYDPWYHTATFRAAESLLQAGLYEDARQRFLHLLSITDNVARKSVIRQRLQKIQLKEQIR